MKIIISIFLSIIIITNIAFSGFAIDINVDAKASLIIDMKSGRILHKSNENARLFPASTTKIMTALLALEKLDLNDKITVTEEDFKGVKPYQSPFNIQIDEEILVIDLLYLLLLPSANEAATILARAVSGNTTAFVSLMNSRAKELGAKGTHFSNPHGLHQDTHYTTASDLAIITTQALKNETFSLIVNTAQKKLSQTNKTPTQRHIYTTNQLILRSTDPTYYGSAYGVKTGFTNPAGYCYVGLAKKKGDAEILTVVLGAEKDEKTGIPKSFTESKKMFKWVFDNFENQEIIKIDENLIEAPLKLSTERDNVVLSAENYVYAMLEKNYNKELLKIEHIPKENIKAPIEIGDILGETIVTYKGEEIGRTRLKAVQSAEMSKVLFFVDVIENFFKTKTFKIIAISLISLIILTFIAKIVIRKKRRERRYKNRTMRNSRKY